MSGQAPKHSSEITIRTAPPREPVQHITARVRERDGSLTTIVIPVTE